MKNDSICGVSIMLGKNKKASATKPKSPKPRPVLGGQKSQKAQTSSNGLQSNVNAAGKKHSLIRDAHAAAAIFSTLCEEYVAATEGYRAKIYQFAARCYEIGYGFMNELEEFELFKADPFWDDVRQKPKDDKIMKAVLVFAMKAKSTQLRNRASKTAFVLESLAAQGVDASEVAEHLKASGGIEKMYRDLSASGKNQSRIPDDLELLSPTVAEAEEVDESDEDVELDAWYDHDDPLGKHEESMPNADDADGQRIKSSAVPRAASDGFKISDFGGQATPREASKLRMNFDPNRDIVIDLSDTGITPEVAQSFEKLFIMAVVRPLENGWRPIKAVAIRKAARISGLYRKQNYDRGEI